MLWDNFKGQFHESWHGKMQPFIESEECDKIYTFLKTESKAGKKLAPLSGNTFRAFKETPMNEMNCVMMGSHPYSSLNAEGHAIADGLLMSCEGKGNLTPTLSKFYDGLEKEFYDGFNLNLIKVTDTSYLSKQGVLMLNSSLTVEIGKPGSHNNIWQPFIAYLYDKIINYTGVPTIFLGEASPNIKYCSKNTENFIISDPNSVSIGNVWDTQGIFSKASQIIWGNNKETIEWLQVDAPF